jgi:predicted nuclease of predicted toxin-antitoxin system
MNIWIDAQLPTALASWLNNTFEVNAMAIAAGRSDRGNYQ